MSDEREVEIPWAVRWAQAKRGPCLDVGCAESTYLGQLPGPVDGIDVRPVPLQPGMRRVFQGDIRTFEFPVRYRTVLAVSTIEHIGLEHAPYGTAADDVEKGDRLALEGCVRACAPGGIVLVSVPFGEQANRGWYRSYDKPGLNALFTGFAWSLTRHVNDEWPVGGVALVVVCA